MRTWAIIFVIIGTETLCLLALLASGLAAVTGFELVSAQAWAFAVTSLKVSIALGGILLLAGINLALVALSSAYGN